jgi:hypothetical protein
MNSGRGRGEIHIYTDVCMTACRWLDSQERSGRTLRRSAQPKSHLRSLTGTLDLGSFPLGLCPLLLGCCFSRIHSLKNAVRECLQSLQRRVMVVPSSIRLKLLSVVLDTTYQEGPEFLVWILAGLRSQAIHATVGREHVVLVHIYLSLLPERRVGD